MKYLCCMSLTLAARIIATSGLSLSILTINIVMSEYFGRTKDGFYNAVEPWSLLGLNWTRFIQYSNIPNRVRVIFSCFFGYLVLYLITSALLATGTVIRKPSFSIPWLYFQIISISDQLIALIFHLASIPNSENTDRSTWYIPLCTFHLTLTIYFWIVVFIARDEWIHNPPRTCNQLDSFNTIADEPIQIIYPQSRPEKSPSFLSQNNTFF